ncbi:MAG: hypothetical protein KAH00_03400 [Cocleimonas sp.]|nr:hypothetical protein [Cocleimonas sp.]
MWHAEYRLYLYPVVRDKPISASALKTALQAIEFISEPLESNNADRYKVGEAFLSLICFMGCSPNIESEPQENSPFCYVEITQESVETYFIAGHNVKKINCHHCKEPQSKLAKNLLEANQQSLLTQKCSVCGECIDPSKINWRKSAFTARSWVLIGNIYESEAVPDEKLLSTLKQVSGCEWEYAYVRMK